MSTGMSTAGPPPPAFSFNYHHQNYTPGPLSASPSLLLCNVHGDRLGKEQPTNSYAVKSVCWVLVDGALRGVVLLGWDHVMSDNNNCAFESRSQLNTSLTVDGSP